MRQPLAIHSYAAIFPNTGENTADTAGLSSFEEARSLRRISHFCRLGLLAAHQCIATNTLSPNAGLIVCSGFGPIGTLFEFTDSIIDYGVDLASPTAFSTSVHNIPASVISMRLGITGPVHTVSQGESSFVAGLYTAFDWLVTGRVQQVLLGGLDEYYAPMDTLLSTLPALSRSGPAEGALFMLLGLDTARHGFLHSWEMGYGEVPALPPKLHCIDEEPVHAIDMPPHPAGPVRALASSLSSNDATTKNICRSRPLNGWWSHVIHERG